MAATCVPWPESSSALPAPVCVAAPPGQQLLPQKHALVDHATDQVGVAAVDPAVDHGDRHAGTAEAGAAHGVEADQRLGLQQLAGAALVGIDRQHRGVGGEAGESGGLDAHRGRRHEREATRHGRAAPDGIPRSPRMSTR